jgi:AcrR family transcriptional regulator
MARPKNTDSEKTRAVILGVAARLFSRKGFHAVGMREIASEAGVTQPAVHHYFGSKDDLHGEVLDIMYAELASAGLEIQAAVLAADTPERAVEIGVRELYRFGIRHRDAVLLGLRESVDASRKIRTGRAQLLGDVLLDQGSEALALLTGKDRSQLRMALLSINFLMSRYVCLNPGERKLLIRSEVGEPLSAVDMDARIEEHLVGTAKRLLLGG